MKPWPIISLILIVLASVGAAVYYVWEASIMGTPLQRPEQHQQPRLQSRKASDRQGMHHCFGNREQCDR